MDDHQAFFDLLDIMEMEKTVAPRRFFALMREGFAIANLLYLDLELRLHGVRIHRLHHTFDQRLVDARLKSDPELLERALRAVADDVRPVDLSDARTRHPAGAALLLPQGEHGPPPAGIVLPLAAPPRRCARLVIHVDLPGDRWPAYRRRHLRDFQLLASLFHAALLESDEEAEPAPAAAVLTGRETDELGGAAAGKSYWEIARILGISERTVRFFMTNARRKLDVVSNTQAVAHAVRHALIPGA